MRWTPRLWMTLAAISGFVAVAAGAFAAHGLADPTAKELMRTGATYEFMHAHGDARLRDLHAGRRCRGRGFAPALLPLAARVLFCGSLYALALGAPRWTGIDHAIRRPRCSWPAGRCWPGPRARSISRRR